MNTQLNLPALGIEEMDGAAMMAVSGGDLLPDWVYKAAVDIGVTLAVCIAKSADSLIDGVAAGWNAAY